MSNNFKIWRNHLLCSRHCGLKGGEREQIFVFHSKTQNMFVFARPSGMKRIIFERKERKVIKCKLRVSRCLLPINLLFHLPCSLNCLHFEIDYFLESNFSTIKLKATFSHIIFAIQISLLWLCFSCKPSFSEAWFKFDFTWWRFRMLLHSTKDVNLFWLDLLGAGSALPREFSQRFASWVCLP